MVSGEILLRKLYLMQMVLLALAPNVPGQVMPLLGLNDGAFLLLMVHILSRWNASLLAVRCLAVKEVSLS